MSHKSINFRQKFGLFDEQWQPKVIAEMNDYQFKVVKLQGDFIWHDHKDTDETFIVVEGDLRIDLRDGAVHVSTGEMFVVPTGVKHKPYAEREVKLLLIERRGVLNTGHEGGERTAADDVWIQFDTICRAAARGSQPHRHSTRGRARAQARRLPQRWRRDRPGSARGRSSVQRGQDSGSTALVQAGRPCWAFVISVDSSPGNRCSTS